MDLNEFVKGLPLANTAMQVSVINEEMERAERVMAEITRQTAEREAIKIRGAEANIEAKELLEQQLEVVKQQNTQLQQNYNLLHELYENAKKEAEESKKEAKHNKFFGWVSFAVGTFIGIAGAVLGIIF